jgi:uncharacterized protein (DUF1015 family)
MRVFAFQGTHYSDGDGADDDPGALVAPPYDQIYDPMRDRLQASHPHHFAHLIRPVAGESADPYRNAARLQAAWLTSAAITMDKNVALYPYEIQLARGGRRLGLTALVGLEEPESGVIRPHEQTLDKPLADRLELLRATRTDLEPILLLASDAGWLDAMLADDIDGWQPLLEHIDASGNRHRIFRVDSADRIGEYQEVLAPIPGAIADGHHRYKTSLLYAREIGAEPGTAAATKLAVITSLKSSHLTIDPIHRALPSFPGFEAIAAVAVERRPWSAAGGEAIGWEFAHAVAQSAQPAVGIWPTGCRPEIWHLDRSLAPKSVPESAAHLPVFLLQEVVYPRLGLEAAAATDGTILYRADPIELHRMVDAGEVAVGIWLPPMSPQEFTEAIADGDMLPPKSTRFLPKVYSGLVWASHDAKVA